MEKRHGGMNMGMGMDSAQGMLFRPVNQGLAEAYWYIIATVLAFTLLVQIVEYVQTSLR